MSDSTPATGRRTDGGYLFVRKGARRVSIDEALPGRAAPVPAVGDLLRAPVGRGELRYVRPPLDPAALDPRLCFFVHPDAPVCDLYRAAAGELSSNAGDARRLLVTSPRERAGRTLTTINLGSALAASDRVVLVDLHRRNPGVARAFGLAEPEGLVAALRRRRRDPGAPVDAVLLADRLAALCLEPDAPPDAMQLGALRPILDAIAASADRVLVDGPPVLDGDHVLDLATLVDGVVLVAEPADLASGDYERAIERFEGRRIVGALINDRGMARR